MRSFVLALAVIVGSASASLAIPVTPVSADATTIQVHGCHHSYARGPTGWHRHDDACRTLRGLVGRKHRHPVKS